MIRTRTLALLAGVMAAGPFVGLLADRAQAAEPAAPAIVSRGYVFGELPTPSCHATTIAETAPGTFVVAWFGGTAEGKPDVGIWTSRLENGSWSKPVEVATGVQADGLRHPCWNPVLFQKPGGELLLFYKVGPNPQDWWGLVRKSRDGGRSWSEPVRLSREGTVIRGGPVGPVKNKPVLLADGTILAGSSTEYDGWRVHMERSRDGGETWEVIGPLNEGEPIGAIQPSILLLGSGKLLAVGRTLKSQRVFRIESSDGGSSWGTMSLLDLPNPNSGTDAVTLADGRHLLVYNHTDKGRTPLNIAMSRDGVTWTPAATLETEPGEYSYPAIIQAADGKVHVTYTWKRQKVAHAVLDLASRSTDAKPASFPIDESTLFSLGVDPESGAFADRAGRVQPRVASGRVVHDAEAGACLQLGDDNLDGIVVQDGGTFDVSRGMTLDAWIRLDTPPVKPAMFARKIGSFDWSLDTGKLSSVWQVFPRAQVFTTTPTQYRDYGFGMDAMNGLASVPVGEWTRLTISYDTALACFTTLIDGMVDRRRYRVSGPEPLQCDARQPLSLLAGLKGCRVAGIRFSSGPPDVAAPSMEAWLNALPYRGQTMITLDHVDPRLPLPIDVVIVHEKATGEATTLRRLTLDTHARRDIVFDTPPWANSIHTFVINAAAGGEQCFTRTLRTAHVKPAGRTLLHEDHCLSRDGRKIFPLLAYHAMPADYPLLAELGFNAIHNDFNLSQAHGHRGSARNQALLECLDAAETHKLSLIPAVNSVFGNLAAISLAKHHPAVLLWYHADEPWGDIARLHDSYNAIKMLEPDLPLLIVQNNPNRLQDTAVAADILAMDPYPIPNVSLRAVADSTKASIRAVAGRKPVWTVLPQYGAKLPTLEELRCMAWLALASGANGLGIYAWDDRVRDPQTNAYKGWHTREHPEHVDILRTVLKEIRDHESILLAPAAARQPAPPPNPAIHALIREADGRRWLIVANDSRRAEEAQLDLGMPSAARATTLLGDGSSLSFTEGTTTLRLPPLGRGVYELHAPPADMP